ncbi:MAG: D-2-hydroxyacid dehydrogenase [Chloroflexi bacterium]|nr:D-2-hydroxyacid dehydrogenase [Chloroflexota bacterium]
MSLVIWPPQSAEWVTAIREAAGDTPVLTPADEAAALAAAPAAEGWVGRLTPALLERAPRLRWLQALSISLEHTVFPDLIAADVTLTNMRHIYDDHIANHVLALFLALCRDLPRLTRRQLAREWAPRTVEVRDPAAMTVLVLGLGGIGAEVVRRLSVLGPTLIGVDPKVIVLPELAELARPAALPDLLPRADAVIICAPHTPETEGLFDEAMFQCMQSTALFINIGRGKIVRLAALERALAEGWIAGAGLDVFETEPLPADSPLWAMENVIITPHTAGFGPAVETRRLAVVLENVRHFVAGQPLTNVTDKARWY